MYEEKQKDHVHVGEAKQVSSHSVLVHVKRMQENVFHCIFISFQRQISIPGILELHAVEPGEHWLCLQLIGCHAPKQTYLRF